MAVFIYIAAALLVMIFVERNNRIRRTKELKERLQSQWGKPCKREIPMEEYVHIPHLFEKQELADYIDDITWQDLDMDRVFQAMNNTNSSVGREHLYMILRSPVYDTSELERRNALIEAVTADEPGRMYIQQQFCTLGFCRKYALSDYMDFLEEARAGRNTAHITGIAAFLAALLFMLFIEPGIGLFLLFIVVGYNVISYYKVKAQIEPFFICIKYVARMSDCCMKLAGQKLPYLDNRKLEHLSRLFLGTARRLKYISSGTDYNGSLLDTLFDYVRMITHIDLIMYNAIINDFKEKQPDIHDMINILGDIEAMTAVASYRVSLKAWCRPVFHDNEKHFLCAKDVYHPLISQPVCNSFHAGTSMLVTGSNASGKSTFLKTVAINGIFAQTIDTCLAKDYETSFFRIFSSMSLRDDLLKGESYYIVEIRSILRIINSCNGEIPVLCFVDEVLRGTNTVERIAASAMILKHLKQKGALCFAATHDIELTRLLAQDYDNYHFEETVTDEDISFNFRLQKGPAVTRNAIKLLKMLHYDTNIVEGAEAMAGHFMQTGVWES